MYVKAADRIGEYRYRKLFGLSKQQLLDEPLEDFHINLFIDNKIAEKQNLDDRRQSIKASNTYGRKR